jgi:hypothetical protein
MSDTTISSTIPSNVFIPSYARNSRDLNVAQRRVLLCGDFGIGKTFTSIITSPNPIVMDIDKGITDPRLVKLGVPTIDIWDDNFCNAALKSTIKCNAVKAFIKGDGMKLAKDQTLIIDSLTSWETEVQNYYWHDTICKKESSGEKNVFWFYDQLKDYWLENFTLLTKLQCHVIICAHLADRRHKENPNITVGYRPLIEGSTKDTIGRFFTDVIRQHAIEKKVGEKITTEYKWQIKSDNMFIAKSRIQSDSMFIPADFNSMIKL